MPRSTTESKEDDNSRPDRLRIDAEDRLQRGAAPQTNGWSLGTDTLTLLYQLAINPDTASDALKLLHELQVHQVELDLQHGQIKSVEDEVARTLSRYQTFYEYAPVAYFALTLDGMVIEANQAGTLLLGIDRYDLRDKPIVNYLAPASRPAVSSLFDRLRAGATNATCQAQSAPGTNQPPQTLLLSASVPLHFEVVLLTATVPA
jgi:PAS domain-containing protein